MTQIKNRFPQHEEDFATAFLDALDNPMDLWKYAFDRNLSFQAQYVLWALVSLPDEVKITDLERVFSPFQRYMAEYYMHTIEATDFYDAIEELEGTFIEINFLSKGVRTIRFHNPSIRDFLETYLCEHATVVKFLVLSAQFFDQLRWLWGKYQIGFHHDKKPVQIRPRYREHLIKIQDDFFENLKRTIYSETPFFDIDIADDFDIDTTDDLEFTINPSARPYSLASRILLLIDISLVIKDVRLINLISNSMPALKEHAKLGKELSFELMKLTRSLKDSLYFSDVKDAFLYSLNSPVDFGRYLIFKFRYSDRLDTNDEKFVEERFSTLYPGQDLSSVDDDEDYSYERDVEFFDYADDDDGQSRENAFEFKQDNDPNQAITDLFDGLNT